MGISESTRAYMEKNKIYEHPEYGFCKLGDWHIDAERGTMTLSIIPVQLVYQFTIDTKTGEINVLPGN